MTESRNASRWSEAEVYRHIGEYVVTFQWIEHKFREIGWYILDPSRRDWPPRELRNLTSAELSERVWKLFLDALPRCQLGRIEAQFREGVALNRERFTKIRQDRNKILHSAFIELKAGGEVMGLMRAGIRLEEDPETGEPLIDSEFLNEASFKNQMLAMGELAIFLNHCQSQLIHRLPCNGETLAPVREDDDR